MRLCKTSCIDDDGGQTMTCLQVQAHDNRGKRIWFASEFRSRGSSVPTNMIESLYPPDPPQRTIVRQTNVGNTTNTTNNE
jgi:hypothetical protein